MKDWTKLSHEIHEWSTENFGKQDLCRRVCGYMEEHHYEYEHEYFRSKALDALADAAIYLLDLAGALGVSDQVHPHGGWQTVGRLAQACLKLDQGIRSEDGGAAWRAMAVDDLNNLLFRLKADAETWDEKDFLGLVNRTWEQVKKRDWKADPVRGGQ